MVFAKVAAAIGFAALLLGSPPAFGQFHLFSKGLRVGKVSFGLGLPYLSELQKSLTISSSSGTVTIHDLDLGTTQTSLVDEDPRLLNRKFDIEWTVTGPGVQVPITLLDVQAGSWAQISSVLALQALKGDFDLRFLNQREPGPSDSLHGRVSQYSVELDLRANLGRAWFAEGGYRFQDNPTVDAERSRPFASPGLQVLSDQSRLSRETHDAISRFGYSFSAKDIVTYTGVRHRWASVEVEDELRLFNPLFNEETTLQTRTKLEGRATEAIVGVEARRGSFIGRTEVTFNERDYGVLTTVVYKGSEFTRREIDAFALSVASQLTRIEADFRARRESLTKVSVGPGGTDYLASEVALLLDSTEARLLNVLYLKELAPLRSSIQFRFRRFRRDLGLIPPAARARPPTSDIHQGITFAAYRLAQAGSDRSPSKMGELLDKVGELLLRATGLASTGGFTLNLCVDSSPRGASFKLRPKQYSGGPKGTTAKKRLAVRGSYSCFFSYEGRKISIPMDPNDPNNPDDTCVDLWETDGDQLLECNLRIKKCAPPRRPPTQGCP